MVRVLAIADEIAAALTPEAARRLEPDLVLSAGDLPWDYVESFASGLDVPVVFVPGNHDPEVGSGGPRGATSADDTVLDVAGLRIAGLGGCVRYNNGHNQYTQREYAGKAKRLVRRAQRLRPAGDVDVLLTHAPPRGVGDEQDPAHVGIDALGKVLDALRPTWHLHGHIHPYGLPKHDRQVGPTTVRNVIPWKMVEIGSSHGA